VLELFSAETVEEVSGKKVVLRSLAKEARQRLLESSEVDQWDVESTVEFLSDKTWFRFLPNFKSKRAWNRWLSKLYAYLRTFLPESRYAGNCIDKKDRALGCYIFPTEWSDSKKTYRLSRYKLPDERLYRLPREQAKLPLEAFYRISVLNQGFEDYVRGRSGNMTEEERSAVEYTRIFLERLEIQTLEPDIIARDFISPLFSDVSRHLERSLVDYTCFVCEHKGEIKKKSINLMLLNREGECRKPCDLLLGQAYGAFDTERFFGGAADDIFVSETYLDKTSISNKQWVDFFVWLGVNESLPLKTLKDVVPKCNIQERLGEHSIGLENMFLRSSYIDEDFPGNSFLVVDVDFSAPVVARLEAIRQLPLMSKIDCMRAFLRLLDEHWEQQYSKHLKVRVKYYAAYEHADSRPHITPRGLNTRIATYLLELNWVPATSSDDLRKAEQVVALTDENAPLAEEGVVLCAERVKNESFLKFLGFRPAPAGVTTLHRLMNLKNSKSQNLDLYKELYGLICTDTENGKLSDREVRRDFNDNKLIYANGSFWAPDEIMFNPPIALRLYFPVLSEVYPGMGEFFSKVLGCDDDNPSIDKILLYFLNFLWVTNRGMDDTLRASLLYCYRRLLDYVGEQESSDYQDHPLWRRFIGKCKVFCRRAGWTFSRTDKPVVFIDVPKHEDHFFGCDRIHIESHLRQLNRDTRDLVPLLELLNVKAASQFVEEVISTSDEHVHENTHEIERNIDVLLDSIIDVLSDKYQDSNRKERTELNKFVEKLREFRQRRKVVYRTESIASRVSLDGAELFKVVKTCHIQEEGALLKIFVSGDFNIVYGLFSGELCGVLGTALLPGNIQKVVRLMIDRTVANIEGNFQKSIETICRDLGFGEPSETITAVKEAEEDMVEVDTNVEEFSATETSDVQEKKNYDDVTEPIDYSGVSLVTVVGDDVSPPDAAGDVGKKGSDKGRASKRHFTPNPYSDEDGKRGEKIVFQKEKERLQEIGLADYLPRITHVSKIRRGHPWDIESFDKKQGTEEVIPIRIEVKATTDPQNLMFPISEPEFRAALETESPKGPYFIYRVFSVRSATPRIKRYEFHTLFHKNKISIKRAKDFYLELPPSEEDKGAEET